MAAACAPGFDCAYHNSCPNFILDCPPGFFCSSYENFTHVDRMDYSYASYLALFDNSVTVTPATAADYVPADRVIQSWCLAGFYCPNATTIVPCPAGHWCAERTAEPQQCDGLSACGEFAHFQVNFVNTVIMGAILLFAFICSYVLTTQQARRDHKSHKKDPAARVASSMFTHDVDNQSNSEDQRAIEVYFENIKFIAPNNPNRVILPEVSGFIPAAKITALMGPTACGKSTLLNILRQAGVGAAYGKVQMSIRKNDSVTVVDPAIAKQYIGHVLQEDILDRNLTVRELLYFNAVTRSKNDSTTNNNPAAIASIVDDVLSDLAIQHVADSIIGGGENQAANISGGQLKRVNIACELVALQRPALLLLDEPTAGLDASIAYELIQTLESFKQRGITIFMVIQQPRAEIFERIDHLFLMNGAGGIVYEGKSSLVVSYLHSIGYQPNELANDADYCLDVLNGICDVDIDNNDDNDDQQKVTLDCSSLHILWKTKQSNSSSDIEEAAGGHSNNSKRGANNVSNSNRSTMSLENTTSTSLQILSIFFWHAYYNAKRLLMIRFRNRSSLITYFLVDFIMAIALAVGFTIYLTKSYLGVLSPTVDTVLQPYFPSALQKYAENNVTALGLSQLLFFISSALGSAAALSAVPVFAGQSELAKRENAAGISVWSFAFGRMAGDTFFVLLNSCVFAGFWGLFGDPGHFYDWLAVIIPTAFAASGIGYIASATYPSSTASSWAIVASFISSVFAGVEPHLAQVNRYPVVDWPWYLNFATWTAEATYYTWAKYLTDNGHVPVPVQEGADNYGFNIENGLARSVGAMMGLGVAMRVLAAILLWRRVK
jgi:ABC-type multidrug transport system ATPase subunit